MVMIAGAVGVEGQLTLETSRIKMVLGRPVKDGRRGRKQKKESERGGRGR
jgi:hypothetical protein